LELLYTKGETNLIGQHHLAQYGFSNKVFEMRKTMILRRVWFAIWFTELPDGKFGKNSLSEHTRLVYGKMIGEAAGGSIAQKMLALCIQQDKVNKKYMLPEEMDWLTRKGLL